MKTDNNDKFHRKDQDLLLCVVREQSLSVCRDSNERRGKIESHVCMFPVNIINGLSNAWHSLSLCNNRKQANCKPLAESYSNACSR